jgi:hypothetical protein
MESRLAIPSILGGPLPPFGTGLGCRDDVASSLMLYARQGLDIGNIAAGLQEASEERRPEFIQIKQVFELLGFDAYKIDYSGVDARPEMRFMHLKIMVGERGFEPPTPWSRTREFKNPKCFIWCRLGARTLFFLSPQLYRTCTENSPHAIDERSIL